MPFVALQGAAPAKRYDWVCHHSKSRKTQKNFMIFDFYHKFLWVK